MKQLALLIAFLGTVLLLHAQVPDVKIKKRDRKRDVEMVTTAGTIILRLSDSTPGHRDNFLKLVKTRFYDSLLLHRVMQAFMIQGGDPNSKRAEAGKPLGGGGLNYTLSAEFRPSLFHKKGALAAARTGDNVNPEKRSSSCQFYIVQGKTFTDAELEEVQRTRMQGRTIPPDHRAVYQTVGGAPHLDGAYTVFGQVVQGLEVVDSIAVTPVSRGADRDRPLQDARILSVRLVKRNKKLPFDF